MPLKIKFYLSDDGFGHIVRQEAIIKELFKLRNDIDIVVQTESKIDVVKEKFGDSLRYIEKFNNIKTVIVLIFGAKIWCEPRWPIWTIFGTLMIANRRVGSTRAARRVTTAAQLSGTKRP